MKKYLTIVILSIVILSNSGCATLLGGAKDDCQRHRPDPARPRKMRAAAFVFDLLIWPPGLAIDFIDGKIYRPCSAYKK